LSTPQLHLDVTTDQDAGVVRLNLRDDDGRHLDAHAVRLGDHPPATEDDVLAAAFALAADAGTRRAEPAAVAEAVKEEPGYTSTALALLRAGGDRGDLSASSASREPEIVIKSFRDFHGQDTPPTELRTVSDLGP